MKCLTMELDKASDIIKALFFSTKTTDIFLISPQKHMFWVFIRREGTSYEYHIVCFHEK